MTPCPRDHAALTTAFCPDCGAARPEAPAEMSEDERIGETLMSLRPGFRGLRWWQLAPSDQATALTMVAKARELLCQTAKLPDEDLGLLRSAAKREDWGVWVALPPKLARSILDILSAPPAQPEPKVEPPEDVDEHMALETENAYRRRVGRPEVADSSSFSPEYWEARVDAARKQRLAAPAAAPEPVGERAKRVVWTWAFDEEMAVTDTMAGAWETSCAEAEKWAARHDGSLVYRVTIIAERATPADTAKGKE